jgi:hypothetical protein
MIGGTRLSDRHKVPGIIGNVPSTIGENHPRTETARKSHQKPGGQAPPGLFIMFFLATSYF